MGQTNSGPAQKANGQSSVLRERAYFYIELFRLFGTRIGFEFIDVYLRAVNGGGSISFERREMEGSGRAFVVAVCGGERAEASIELYHEGRAGKLMEKAAVLIAQEKENGILEQLAAKVSINLSCMGNIVRAFSKLVENEGKGGEFEARAAFVALYNDVRKYAEKDDGLLPAFVAAELFCMYVLERAERADVNRRRRYEALVRNYWEGTLNESEVKRIKENPVEEKLLMRKAAQPARIYSGKHARQLVALLKEYVDGGAGKEEALERLESDSRARHILGKDPFEVFVNGVRWKLKKKIAAEIFDGYQGKQQEIDEFFKRALESQSLAGRDDAAERKRAQSRRLVRGFEERFGAGSFPITVEEVDYETRAWLLANEAADRLLNEMGIVQAGIDGEFGTIVEVLTADEKTVGGEREKTLMKGDRTDAHEMVERLREMLNWLYKYKV